MGSGLWRHLRRRHRRRRPERPADVGWQIEHHSREYDRFPCSTPRHSGLAHFSGDTVLLSVDFSSADPVQIQWLLNGQEIHGANSSTFQINNLQSNRVGSYSVRLRTAAREVFTLPTDLQINSEGEENGAAHDKLAELTLPPTPPPTPPPPPPRAARAVALAAAGPARGFTSSQVFSTFGATKEIGEPNHCEIPGGASEWYVYQAPASDTLHIDTDGSDFDTVLAVYTGPGTDFASLVPVACDNDHGLDGQDSSVQFNATQGTIYYIAVDGVGGATGTVVLNFNLGEAPAITDQPVGVISQLGAQVSLSVATTGMTPLSYQWRRDGVTIPGATNTTLTFNPVQAAHAGHYTVLVGNPIARLTSAVAVVIAPPLDQIRYQIHHRHSRCH